MVQMVQYVLLLLFIYGYKGVYSRSPPWNLDSLCVCRIVGGDPVTIEDVPYQVHLRMEMPGGVHFCGGSIINSRTVLTAAHCIKGASSVTVLTSTANIDQGGSSYTTNNTIMHPNYSRPQQLDYDVGIIKLDNPMDLDGVKAKPVKLAESGTETEAGTPVLVSGWGRTAETSPGSKVLMAVKVPVVSEEDCKNAYGTSITKRMLCASDTGKDACGGDSGGPAVSQTTGEQVGIVSWGYGCARPEYPGVYAKVADPSIRDFIKKNTVEE